MAQEVDYDALAKASGGTSAPASSSMDYDALAKQHGGTIATASAKQGSAPVDYDALAKEHGGTANHLDTETSAAAARLQAHPIEGATISRGPSTWESFKGAVEHPVEYLGDVEADTQQGGGRTIVGRALGHMQHGSMNDTGYEANQTPVASIMAGPIQGPPKVLRGLARIGRESTLRGKVGGVNEAVSGAIQTPGPFLLASPEALTRAIPAMLFSNITESGLKKLGVPDEYAELGGNVVGAAGAMVPEDPGMITRGVAKTLDITAGKPVRGMLKKILPTSLAPSIEENVHVPGRTAGLTTSEKMITALDDKVDAAREKLRIAEKENTSGTLKPTATQAASFNKAKGEFTTAVERAKAARETIPYEHVARDVPSLEQGWPTKPPTGPLGRAIDRPLQLKQERPSEYLIRHTNQRDLIEGLKTDNHLFQLPKTENAPYFLEPNGGYEPPASEVEVAPTIQAPKEPAAPKARPMPASPLGDMNAPVATARPIPVEKAPQIRPADVETQLNRGLGNEPIKQGVPMKDQGKASTAPEKFSSRPDKATLQKAGASDEEIAKILPLTKVELSKLAGHFNVDLGDSAIGRGKGDIKAGTHIPREEVMQRIIDAGHSPADIAKATDEGAHLPTVSGGSQGATEASRSDDLARSAKEFTDKMYPGIKDTVQQIENRMTSNTGARPVATGVESTYKAPTILPREANIAADVMNRKMSAASRPLSKEASDINALHDARVRLGLPSSESKPTMPESMGGQKPVTKAPERLATRATAVYAFSEAPGDLLTRHTIEVKDPQGKSLGKVSAMSENDHPETWTVRLSAAAKPGTGLVQEGYAKLAEEAAKQGKTLRGDSVQSDSAKAVWSNLKRMGFDVKMDGETPYIEPPSTKPKARGFGRAKQ